MSPRSTRLCLLPVTVLVGVGGGSLRTDAQAPCNAKLLCIAADSTLPGSLTKIHGDNQDYFFESTADVNGAAGVYTYEHQIANRHGTKVLWTEWSDGDMVFQMIGPCGCAAGYRQSGIAPEENPKSRIVYGQNRNVQSIGSAYVRTQAVRSQPIPPSVPSLATRLVARVLVRNEPADVNLVFTTELSSDRRFTYAIENRGTQLLLFQMTGLAERWAQYIKTGVMAQSGWATSDSTALIFRAPEKSTTILSLETPAGVSAFNEETADLRLLSSGGEPISLSRVSVYVPVPRSAQAR